MSRIWIGGLSTRVDERDLEDLFTEYGSVTRVALRSSNADTFAFVEFQESDAGEIAIEEMDQRKIRGRRVKVSWAKRKGEMLPGRRYGRPVRRTSRRRIRSSPRPRSRSRSRPRERKHRRRSRSSSRNSKRPKDEKLKNSRRR